MLNEIIYRQDWIGEIIFEQNDNFVTILEFERWTYLYVY